MLDRPEDLRYAASLSQPWAWCVVNYRGRDAKRIENRRWSWSPATIAKWTGVRIAIHAAQSWDADAQHAIRSQGIPCPMQVELARGALIGAATIKRVFTMDEAIADASLVPEGQAKWAFGPLCLLLADVVPIAKPVTCRGMLGMWWIPDRQHHELVEQLAEVDHA